MDIVEPSEGEFLDALRLGHSMWSESPTYSGMEPNIDHMIEFGYHCLRDADTFFNVAVDEAGTVVGFLIGSIAPHGFHDSTFAFDRLIYVDPSKRGMIVGKALITAFETWATDKGVTRVMLGVTTGINTDRTVRLYNALGYNTVGVLTMKEIA